MTIYDIFDGIRSYGYLYLLVIVLSTLLFQFVKRELRTMFKYVQENTNKILNIHDSIKNKNTGEIISRSDILDKIEEVKRDCTDVDCPFQQDMIGKMEEFVWNSERLEKTFAAWKENSGRINEQISTTLAAATEDMRRVNHELLSLVRSVIERSTNGKREVPERTHD